MLSKKAERRLTKLVRFMASLPKSADKHFFMGDWFSHDGEDHDHDLFDKPQITRRDLNLCGTSACAFGWAATIPSFRRQGLTLTPNTVVFKNEDGLEAASAFFDIDCERSHDLFSGVNADKTPRAWAKRARKLLRRWKKEKA